MEGASHGSFRYRNNLSKTRYSVGSKRDQPSQEQRMLERYLEHKYRINRQDELFQESSDLVSSKQIYEMLDAAHRTDDKENQQSHSNFTFKKVAKTMRDPPDSHTVEKGNSQHGELLRRLQRAQREIDTQKKRVKQLQGHLKQSRSQMNSADKKNEQSIHSRFVQRVQQMMESVQGQPGPNNLQQIWRWLKNKMEGYQEYRLVMRQLQQLIADKELVRAEEIQRILTSKRI